MADDAELKLTLRLVPADGRPADPAVLDDITRLIRQAIATAPTDSPKVTEPAAGFREPSGEETRDLRKLASKIESRIQVASEESRATVAQRAELGDQPDEARAAAERVVAAVQRALFRGVAVRVPDPGNR